MAEESEVKEVVKNCNDDREKGIMTKLREKFGGMVMDVFRGLNANNEHLISHDQIRQDLRELITVDERSDAFIFIVDVFDTQVVYGRELPSGEVDLFSRNYSIENSDPANFSIEIEDPVEVRQVVTFEPVSNTQKEESPMDRDALIERLATHEATPFTREQLTDLSDEQLSYMATNLEAEATEDPTKEGIVPTPVEDLGKPTEVVKPKEEGAIAGVDPEVVAALNALGADGIKQIQNSAAELADQREETKKALVSKLVANDRVTMDEATLRRMDLEALEGVARMAGIDTSYAGVGGPVVNRKESSGPPSPPSIVLPDSE